MIIGTNLLIALVNLQEVNNGLISPFYENENRINSEGITLEYLVKDIFCNSLSIISKDEKDLEHQKHLSYLGNQSNPPDFIIAKNEAVEVKKIKTAGTEIALNSSHPKAVLKCNNSRITKACRGCEDEHGGWQEKDLIYCVGVVKTENVSSSQIYVLKNIWFVYGNCYAASEEHYKTQFNKIKNHLEVLGESMGGMEETNELGKLKRVDPLGITSLRIRGMWHIENPRKVFSYVIKNQDETPVIALLLKDKFLGLLSSTPKEDIGVLEAKYQIKEVLIKNPDNPAQNLEAVTIRGKL